MALTNDQMARLGELLDESLPLSLEQRRAWLDSLQPEDEPLRQTLSDALLADDPAPAAGRLLGRPPRLLATPDADDEVAYRAGARLGAYELLRPLGHGGMAEVWLARRADGAFERQVALKIPRLGQLPSAMSDRFARECTILASLEVVGVARLYDAGIDQRGVPYIAMEYVPGEPLTNWCDASQLCTQERVALFLQVIDAVGRAHAKQIIHRDLKPSNIFVTKQGEVRLLDFGVARLLEGETHGSTLTHAWGRALTPAYASPEMLRGSSVDARTDIYSLGVVLHELLTGARPVDGDTAKHPAGDTARLTSGLRAVLKKALAPSPDDRYPDAASFAAALRPFASTPMTSRPSTRRTFGRALLAAGVAAVLVLGAFVLLGRRPRTEEASIIAPATSEVSLAVLPFADLSPARDQEYLCEGMSDEIINQLVQIPSLRLVGLRSTLQFKGRNEDLRAIGEKLGVEHLLDGTIRKDRDRLRVTAQLVRARDGTPLWSSLYERELSDVFAVQEEIARDVAKALPVKLDVGPMSRAQGGTTNLDAYDRYLRWRQLFLAERQTVEDRRKRTQLLREATNFDSRFVLAWGELAEELELLAYDLENAAVDLGGSQVPSLRDQAARARARVLALAPESWMALRIRSEQLANEKRWAESIEVARRILDTGPFTLERAYPYINVIFAVGHIDETIELVDRVIRIEPLARFPSRDQQWNLTAARRYREAEAEYQRSRGFEGSHATPDYIAFLRVLASQASNRSAIRAAYEQLQSNFAADERGAFMNGLGPSLDKPEALRGMIRQMVEERQPQFEVTYHLADAIGESELALSALHAHLAAPGNRDFRKYWEVWIVPYSDVRRLPGYKALLRDAGIVEYWRKTGHWGDFCKPIGGNDFECR